VRNKVRYHSWFATTVGYTVEPVSRVFFTVKPQPTGWDLFWSMMRGLYQTFSSMASRTLRYETCFDRWWAAYEYIGSMPNANDAREEFFTYLNGTPSTRVLYVMRVRQTKITQTVNVSFEKDV
jgi:hypothetical protein